MAAKSSPTAGTSINEAEISARLDLILTKLALLEVRLAGLDERLMQAPIPILPTSIDLWDTRHIGAYLKRSTDNVRKEIVCLPSFARPVRLPVHGKAQALYLAREVIEWAKSFKEKRRK